MYKFDLFMYKFDHFMYAGGYFIKVGVFFAFFCFFVYTFAASGLSKDNGSKHG